MQGQKKRGRPPLLRSQGGGDDVAAGLKGKAVLVPSSALAALSSVHGPGRYLHGIIKGKDSGRQGCVLIKCREDPRTFYFDVGQVQGWMQEEEDFKVCLNEDAQPRRRKEQHGREEEEQQSKRACMGHTTSSSGRSIPNIDLTAEDSRPEAPMGGFPPKLRGYTTKAEVADLTGKEVDIPGTVFQNHTPGLTFRAYIMGPDNEQTSHRHTTTPAVVLRLLDGPQSRYFFYASEVREWLRETQLGALPVDGGDVKESDTQEDMLAAEALAHMSAGTGSMAPCTSPSNDARQPAGPILQPAVHAARMKQPEEVASAEPEAHLCLGPSELIAQSPSLLPSSLAEKLLRIASLHSASAETMPS